MREVSVVRLAHSDEEILACYPVIRELRTHLAEAEFLPRVRAQEADGYRLAYVAVGHQCVAVAGFRILENLAYGRHVYVDDLVTSPDARSSGHGSALLDWLSNWGRENGCTGLHLDSGTQRQAAHRFYHRERMEIVNFHFAKAI